MPNLFKDAQSTQTHEWDCLCAFNLLWKPAQSGERNDLVFFVFFPICVGRVIFEDGML